MPPPNRTSDVDACPGALRLHAAADGPLARVRLPGGQISGTQLRALRLLAAEFGDGFLELTSRANVQLRALGGADPGILADRLAAAGLFPSASHETVRNIMGPAVAGPAVRETIAALDDALCADPALAALPGRFLFAVGGMPATADAAALPIDAAALSCGLPGLPHNESMPDDTAPALPGGKAVQGDSGTTDATATASPGGTATASPGGTATASPGGAATRTHAAAAPGDAGAPAGVVIAVGGFDFGLRVPASRAVEALLAVAHAFLAVRDASTDADSSGDAGVAAWRVRELADGPERVARVAAEALGVRAGRQGAPVALDAAAGAGVRGLGDGRAALVALVPLGRLSGVQAEILEGAARLVVTAERGVVLPDLTAGEAADWVERLGAAGFALQPGSRWSGVTACAGRPGCAKALADVRADAMTATRHVDGLPVHWAGCSRGCGSPAGPHVRVEATDGGYLVTTPGADPAEVYTVTGSTGPAIAAARLGDVVAVARRP